MAHRERLDKLADVLVTYTGPVRFDMGVFYEVRGGIDCGTAACAIGLATLHPWFKARGLALSRHPEIRQMIPCFGPHDGWKAVQEFFQISEKDAQALFSARSYQHLSTSDITKGMVSARIKSFIASNVDRYGE